MPDMPDFTILPFREQERVTWQQVVELIDRNGGRFLRPFSEASRSGPRDDVTPFVAVSDAGELLGHAWVDAGECGVWRVYDLSMLCVREDSRRRGIARALVAAIASKYLPLECLIERKDHAMHALAEDVGFVRKGDTRRVYYLR